MRRKISKEHLLNDYRQLKRTLGRRPTCLEFAKRHHSIFLLCGAFGRPGWRSFLAEAGDKPHHKPAGTRDMLIQDYHDLKKKLGRQPDYKEYEEECYGYWIINRIFGRPGWQRLVEAAGDTPFIKSNPSEDILVQAYRALRKKLRRQPRCNEYCKECYSQGVITAVFGRYGWRNLVRAAGDKPLIAFNKPFIDRNLNAVHLMKDFLELQDSLGRRPKLIEYTYQCHTPKVLDRVFGKPGWRRLIKATGKKAMPKSYRLDAEHLIQDYLDTAHAIGRKPSYSHFHARHRHSLKVLIRVFGKPGWSNLRKAAAGKKRKAGVRAHGHRTEAAAARTKKIARPLNQINETNETNNTAR